jgi:hypothetical protein
LTEMTETSIDDEKKRRAFEQTARGMAGRIHI